MESPFASWMDQFVIVHPKQSPAKNSVDAFIDSLVQKGYEHEHTLESSFIDQGLTLIRINGLSADKKYANTIEAMHQGVDVIVQARLELEPFIGYADFLMKVQHAEDSDSLLGDWHYEVWDAKLSNTLKPTFAIQLCCYTQMLESMQGYLPKFITVILGNNHNECLRISDFYYYYQKLRSSFLKYQNDFNSNKIPDPAHSKNWGDWSNFAKFLILEKDHLFLVATITKRQIKKLNKAGIKTMQGLANSFVDHVPGINPAVLTKLKVQAVVQKNSAGNDVPKFKIIKTEFNEEPGLVLLPPHSPLDVFFDIEGYPFYKGGLEYLWGNAYFDHKGHRKFIDFWAHNEEQEKRAFQDFINWVYQRWQKDLRMHIYHYANYEIAACRRIMGRYSVCEYEVEQLLRNEVFIDLYKIFKDSILLGEPRYSIKNVEHLYRHKRKTKVSNGGDSILAYELWRTLNKQGEQGDTWQTSKILNVIRDYNIDDCESTQELVNWLRRQQVELGIGYLDKIEITEPDVKKETTERILLRERLLTRSLSELETNPKQSALTQNLAWVLEFHWREVKPIFWRLFEKLGLSHIELIDDLDCLAYCHRTERKPFKPTSRTHNLAYEYHFDAAQEFKGVQNKFYLLGMKDKDGNTAKATLVRDGSDLENGLIVLQLKEEPPLIISLVPDEYVNPNPLPQAISQIVNEYANGELISEQSAIIDFLTRSKPKIKGHIEGQIAPSRDSKERLQQIIHAVSNLEHSYLAIQGPPGAGKSYISKHVIAELMKFGTRVGISSNSHEVINNLLLNTAKYCKEEGITTTFSCTKDNDPALADYDITILNNNDLINHIQPACVIGTTAWGFARGEIVDQFDYLFVDEVGQVSIANLIAMSRSATNLIVIGDQMQLGQPLRGTHPAESGLSVLEYLLHETPTIPDDMGIFLGTTYRMHSMINQHISEHIYEGKLKSAHNNDKRIIEVPTDYYGPLKAEAGVVFIPVKHEGNIQASDQEVVKIKELADDLIERTFHTGVSHPEIRTIGWNDIIFIAPYNYQVRKLRIALGERAKIGSIDKFQGQEAPIIFLSMCTSDANEYFRDCYFIFNKHRINVAISRAQSLAVVVGNPNIDKTIVNTVDQIKLINLFNAITIG